ncbi:hypothetical protein [Nocardia wallacei]|uniref:hypothetical protein n=1 Tax=Nocardia wallacei TaxID=480035 RepID=UPI002455972B|nr:hypothetical protein [Nocardia wallacei]
MPRETVHQVVSDGVKTSLDVHWGRDTFVQLGVARDEGKQGSSLWSESLTRDQINHLIRVLRRARDQAYGRDE